MRLVKKLPLILSTTIISGLTALLFSVAAYSQYMPHDATELGMRFQSGPDEYLFFDEDTTKKVVDYQQERIIRVCVDQSRQAVAMTVMYDDKTARVQPGDCMRIEAKQVALSPAAELETGTVLRTEVDTIS